MPVKGIVFYKLGKTENEFIKDGRYNGIPYYNNNILTPEKKSNNFSKTRTDVYSKKYENNMNFVEELASNNV